MWIFCCVPFLSKLAYAVAPICRDPIKYEEVHLKVYADGCEARSGISSWMNFYNLRRELCGKVGDGVI
jgi:hypothetical protein